jgi:3-hydroxyacyl-CoA dehydrogenase/enoyl-CoA hydratase/carnithine racemase
MDTFGSVLISKKSIDREYLSLHSTTMTVRIIDFSAVSTNKLNPLGSKLRNYIWNELHASLQDSNVSSIVLTGGKHANFSAGADLTEFSGLLEGENNDISNTNVVGSNMPTLIDVVRQIEQSSKPVVACIRGACLGGGLEVALSCHVRIASSDNTMTKIGLPEVHVGVIPGAGGTQRLPRLIGLQNALSVILSGKPVSPSRALQMKLVDAIVSNDHLESTAIQMASQAENLTIRRTSALKVPEDPPTAHVLCRVASLSLPKQGANGWMAALEACRASVTMPFEKGMQREKELFLQVLLSKEGMALRHAFFAVRLAQKMTVPADTNHVLLQKDISRTYTAVIGAGTMGGGIALVLLQAGFPVTLVDVSQPALEKGIVLIQKTIESYVKRKRITTDASEQLLSRLNSTQRLEDLSDCHLVVEAVVENMAIKQSVFRTLDRVTSPNCLILSNTSTLDIDEMASVLDAPHRRRSFAGWHFFSPAHVMKLVEIVVGKQTSPKTVALLQSLTKRIGKIGVVVGNCDGFCGNRLLRPYSAETVMLVVEGGGNTTIEHVDAALKRFGMALGPFQLSDLAGNDVGYNIRRERGWVRDKNAKDSPPKRPQRYTEVADAMVSELGRFGQKVGKGWYDYDHSIGKGRFPLPSKEMADFVKIYVQQGQVYPRLSDKEIVERVLYPLINEGFKCLEEGIARCPSDIDVIYLYGYGWPAWRGGPMYYADHDVGLPKLYNKLSEFYQRFPMTEHYKPSKLLEKCVRAGLTVEMYYRRGMHQSTQSKL